MTETASVRVGDFLVSSWGYDQTNIDFYKVVGVTASGKSVNLQKWTSVRVQTDSADFTSEAVVPGVEPATVSKWTDEGHEWSDAPIFRKKLHSYGGRPSVEIASYANAYLWSGSPAYQTAAGYGH